MGIPNHPHRARRGATAQAVLLALADGPKHGYELITDLEERSDGQWRPSPGAMYPALNRLEERGLIEGHETEGKRRYSLTEEGREVLARRDPDAPPPWESDGGRPGGALRSLVSEIGGQTRQLGRFGTDKQRDEAIAILADAKAKLYNVLAETEHR